MPVQRPNWLLRFINPKDGRLDSHSQQTLQQIVTQANDPTYPTLVSAANDAAAAAAGVLVGHLYRNGSVVMIRVT